MANNNYQPITVKATFIHATTLNSQANGHVIINFAYPDRTTYTILLYIEGALILCLYFTIYKTQCNILSDVIIRISNTLQNHPVIIQDISNHLYNNFNITLTL